MSLRHDKDPTEFFSVVGAPYVPEHRDDNDRVHLSERSVDFRQPETGVAVLWLVFYGIVIGVSLVASGGAGRLVELALVVLK